MDSTQRKGINFDLDTEELKNIIPKGIGTMRIMMYGLILKRTDLNISKAPVIIPLKL